MLFYIQLRTILTRCNWKLTSGRNLSSALARKVGAPTAVRKIGHVYEHSIPMEGDVSLKAFSFFEKVVNENLQTTGNVSLESPVWMGHLLVDKNDEPQLFTPNADGSEHTVNVKPIDAFTPNSFFLNAPRIGLYDFLKNFTHLDEPLISLAQFQKEGWMHIADERAGCIPFGRVPDPDDILGHVEVRNSKIVPLSFQIMPTYRILNIQGFLKLPESLHSSYLQNFVQPETTR